MEVDRSAPGAAMTSSPANWLSDQDVTTVATERFAAPVPRPAAIVGTASPARPRWAGPTGALTFLAAVWLAMSSFPFYFMYAALWNDVVMGAAIAAVSLARVTKPVETRSLGWVNVVLGAWLVVAPFAWGYSAVPGAPRAVWNDVAVGLMVACLSGLGLLPAADGPDRERT
jgi:hypothetical protein